METLHTLTELLQNSGCEYQIYDLGRRIQPIENTLFEKVEKGLQAYPYPVQRQAQLAIAYWNESQQPWIWFLKFNLDERGLLKQADVGQFIKFVLEAMGSRLSSEMTDEQQQKLANNPYTFKPNEDKMAVFHSHIRAKLNLETSQYYEHAQHYFTGDLGWNNWQTVGLQGITDIAARLSSQQNHIAVRKALPSLPNEPLYALLGALEHTQLPEKLAQRLCDQAKAQIESNQPDLFLLSALVRALSGAQTESVTDIYQAILNSSRLSHQEVLIGIAGRSWHWLTDPKTAELFLLRLAETGNQALFNQLFADLVMLPELRVVMLPLLHSNPSPQLAQALIKLQDHAKAGQ
ncbi:DUF3549 family protein [Vibrio agarivorans]|uniref:DUF3549 family protein n=1 Tax=Vibrio agarivorans TaxID=153622 RepID=A0ABT7Y1B0_9VIBR|nr:DUF3549 family protein [Vibrio agarivorans]MDN2481824.1 DUF3549 family protein [Vibrio agarivorans]